MIFKYTFGHFTNEFLGIIFLADMYRNNPLEIIMEKITKEGIHVCVGEVSLITSDSLNNRGRVGAVADHFMAVVRFEDQRMAIMKSLANEVGRFSQIGSKAETNPIAFDDKANGINGVMANSECADRIVTDVERFTGIKVVQWFNGSYTWIQRIERRLGDIRRDCAFAGKDTNAVYVIAVFMGDKYGLYIVNGFTNFADSGIKLFKAESVINQNLGFAVINKNSVTGTSATE